jgi:hypothetical protein
MAKDIQKTIEDAWLNINVDETKIFNPLRNIPIELEDDPHIYISWLMGRPEYFSFICKEILNIQLLPMQQLILQEMWHRRFPILVMSRGAGKAIRMDWPVRTKDGWTKIKDIKIGDQVYGSDGKLANVISTSGRLKDLEFYKITLRDGREIECCEDHLWLVYNNSKKEVLSTKKLTLEHSIPTNQYLQNEKIEPSERLSKLKTFLRTNELSPIIQKEIIDLARSLGFVCYTNEDKLRITSEKTIQITKIEKIGKQDGCCIMVDNEDHTYITKDYVVTHNSYILAVYALLRALLMPGRKVVICGAVFRQSKVIFNYMESIWNNAPLFRDMMSGTGSGPRHETDMWKFILDESMVTALPIGTGEKIRGQRANDIIMDEFAAGSQEIFENVIAGFAAVKSSPIEGVKAAAAREAAKKLGVYLHDQDEYKMGNQIILSGTAFYIFNHFGEYWQRWRNILRSKGDPHKLQEVFGDNAVPEEFNWKDYSIIRIPYEKMPKGFMDEAMVARSRATIHSGIYEMEFGSCASGDTNIITTTGVKQISKISIGDLVLTHHGRFRKVTKVYKRPYNNKICKLTFENTTQVLKFTPEHPFLNENNSFVPIKDIIDKVYLATENCLQSTKIKNKELIDYKGWVYNLEVEEDHSYSTINATVHNCFSSDSNGFFKRSLIEQCCVNPNNPIVLSDGEVYFSAALEGTAGMDYVYGIDPASEVDNFSIVILEIHKTHRRVIYAWTTNKKEFRAKVKAGLIEETDFYGHCARKIRELMKRFPCSRMAIDSQGGGVAISEALHDHDKLKEGEQPLWPIIDPKKKQDTDGEVGLHILEMVNFASADWVVKANHGLRKDFEDRVCLFPSFDKITLGLAEIYDEQSQRLYDTLEDCITEIEELKDELSTIIHTQTPSGRDHWDTPEVKLPGNRKGYLRKDRYSALVMANMTARQLARDRSIQMVTVTGGFAASVKADPSVEYIGQHG